MPCDIHEKQSEKMQFGRLYEEESLFHSCCVIGERLQMTKLGIKSGRNLMKYSCL